MYLINYRLFRYFNAKNIGYFFGNCLFKIKQKNKFYHTLLLANKYKQKTAEMLKVFKTIKNPKIANEFAHAICDFPSLGYYTRKFRLTF